MYLNLAYEEAEPVLITNRSKDRADNFTVLLGDIVWINAEMILIDLLANKARYHHQSILFFMV